MAQQSGWALQRVQAGSARTMAPHRARLGKAKAYGAHAHAVAQRKRQACLNAAGENSGVAQQQQGAAWHRSGRRAHGSAVFSTPRHEAGHRCLLQRMLGFQGDAEGRISAQVAGN